MNFKPFKFKKVDRRKFLRNSISAGMAPAFLTGFGNQILNASILPASFYGNSSEYEDRCLVILYMAGGNDIVNTILPLDQYDTNYITQRSSTVIDQNSFLSFNDGSNLGFHPSLAGLKKLYSNNELKIIQRVGYEQVNGSHFSAESILLRGIDGTADNSTEKEGWIARFLKNRYPNYVGVPYEGQLDPLGICFANPVKLGFHTIEEHNYHLNLTNQDPAGLYDTVSGISGSPITEFGNSCINEMLQYASLIEKSTQVYSNRIQCLFNEGNNSTVALPNNGSQYLQSDLALQFKTITRLLKGGSKTKVFMVQIGGFDTHVNQLEHHANLLQNVSESITAFHQELLINNLSTKVLTVAFSEFGRKVEDNFSGGTDHGTLSSMFVIGDSLDTNTKGAIGANLDLADINLQGAPNPKQMEYDYRTVYSKILKQWFGATDLALNKTFVPGNNKNYDPVFAESAMPSLIAKPAPIFTPLMSYHLNLNLTVLLEGFIKEDTKEMNTNLLNNDLLPLKQPYQSTRFNYFGVEEVQKIPDTIVDWMYLEIYDNTILELDLCPAPLVNPSNASSFTNISAVGKKALFINKDGRLIDLDGTLGTTFHLFSGSYRLLVYHRFHLGVLVNENINIIDSSINLSINLTEDLDKVTGNNQLKDIGNGTYAMIAGDVDQNGIINNKDHNLIKRNDNTIGYKATDLNGDEITDNNDLDLWRNNKSKIGEPLAHQLIK